jgi:hypothetical protein
MDPNIERILDMGFSPPKDPKKLTFEENKISYLDAQATYVLLNVVSSVVSLAIMPFLSARELWKKLQEKYNVSKMIEDDCIPSTSGCNELSFTSLMFGKTQGNDMVSGDRYCNFCSKLIFYDHSSLSHCNASSSDLNTSSTMNTLHACVDSPCISCVSCLNKSHDDMLTLSRGHDKNASISSSLCVAKNVEDIRDSIGQDKVLIGASSNPSSPSSLGPHICLMARDSKVTPTLEPNLSCDNEEEDDDVASLETKGEILFHAIGKKKIACANFVEILVVAIESKKIINELQSHGEDQEETIENLHSLANDFKSTLLEEQTTKEALEETFSLELSRLKETHDRALVVENDLQLRK